MKIEQKVEKKAKAPKKVAKPKKNNETTKASVTPEVEIKEVKMVKLPKKKTDEEIRAEIRKEIERIIFNGDKTSYHDKKNFRFLRAAMTRIAANAEPMEIIASYKIGKLFEPIKKVVAKAGTYVKFFKDFPGLCLSLETWEVLVEFYVRYKHEFDESTDEAPASKEALFINKIVDRFHIAEVGFKCNSLSKKNMKALESLKKSMEAKNNKKA